MTSVIFRRWRNGCFCTLVLWSGAQALGATVNGDFEGGNLNNWTPSQSLNTYLHWTAAVESAVFAPLAGSYSALLVTPTTATAPCPLEPWAPACPLPDSLFGAPVAPGPALAHAFPDVASINAAGISFNPHAGQSLGQDVDLALGEGIAFEWRTVVEEHDGMGCPVPNGIQPDTAVALLTNGTTVVGLNLYCNGLSPLDTATIKAPAAGVWTLYLGVFNGGDAAGASAILVDNVRVTQAQPMPIPATSGLVVSSLFLLALSRRRRGGFPRFSAGPTRR